MSNIFGRPVSLIVALLGAIVNAGIAFHIAGFTPDQTQIGALNTLILLIVTALANGDINQALNVTPPGGNTSSGPTPPPPPAG